MLRKGWQSCKFYLCKRKTNVSCICCMLYHIDILLLLWNGNRISLVFWMMEINKKL